MQCEWQVQPAEANMSLLAFLQGKFKDCSMRKIKGWIDAGFCTVRGQRVRFSKTCVRAGERVLLHVPQQVQKDIQILFEDDLLLIIDKPAGITCDERLVRDLAKRQKKVELIHRLDKETTGILLCAKTPEIKKYFVEEFRNLAVHKRYVAVVDGVVKGGEGTIENYLGPIQRYQGHVKWGQVHSDGHYACTEWRVLKRGKNASFLELSPKTGKTHQLRVHTSGMGHPILGDHTYAKGFRCPYKATRVLLHAELLAFKHPVNQEIMHFTAPLPEDLAACVKELF